MSTQSYNKTNAVFQRLEAAIETEAGRYGLHDVIEDLMKAIIEEREIAHMEMQSLRHESAIKAFYITELEKSKSLGPASKGPTLSKLEKDLYRVLDSVTDSIHRIKSMQ